MELVEFKDLIRSHSNNRLTSNFDNDLLGLKIETAIKFIAKKTVPTKLVVNTNTTVKVLRKLDAETFIRMPNKPVDDTSIIDIDDALLDATALYVLAGYERAMAKVHMGLCYQEIDDNNERLIDAELAETEDCISQEF